MNMSAKQNSTLLHHYNIKLILPQKYPILFMRYLSGQILYFSVGRDNHLHMQMLTSFSKVPVNQTVKSSNWKTEVRTGLHGDGGGNTQEPKTWKVKGEKRRKNSPKHGRLKRIFRNGDLCFQVAIYLGILCLALQFGAWIRVL